MIYIYIQINVKSSKETQAFEIHIYIYIYIYRERERERTRHRHRDRDIEHQQLGKLGNAKTNFFSNMAFFSESTLCSELLGKWMFCAASKFHLLENSCKDLCSIVALAAAAAAAAVEFAPSSSHRLLHL